MPCVKSCDHTPTSTSTSGYHRYRIHRCRRSSTLFATMAYALVSVASSYNPSCTSLRATSKGFSSLRKERANNIFMHSIGNDINSGKLHTFAASRNQDQYRRQCAIRLNVGTTESLLSSVQLHYRNGGMIDAYSDLSRAEPDKLKVVSWFVGTVLFKPEPMSDANQDKDKYLKFLDQRYNRLHDENFCYNTAKVCTNSDTDELAVVGSGKDRKMPLNEISCVKTMPTWKTELFSAGNSVVKRIQHRRDAFLAAQRKLVFANLLKFSTSTSTFITSMIKMTLWDVARRTRGLVALTATVSLLICTPIFSAMLGRE